MIKVRAIYGEWKEVSLEQAQRFYNSWYAGTTNMPCEDKEDYFNNLHIMGAEVKNGKVVEE